MLLGADSKLDVKGTLATAVDNSGKPFYIRDSRVFDKTVHILYMHGCVSL